VTLTNSLRVATGRLCLRTCGPWRNLAAVVPQRRSPVPFRGWISWKICRKPDRPIRGNDLASQNASCRNSVWKWRSSHRSFACGKLHTAQSCSPTPPSVAVGTPQDHGYLEP